MIVNTLTLGDAGYPNILTEISQPPKEIYWLGHNPMSWLAKPRLAVVGSRKITPYGKVVTEKLVSELAKNGVVIISGLAYGVDVTAHRAALSVGGLTVAVLPSSISNIYPVGHTSVAEKITRHGTLITEYRDENIAFKSNFIARNRLISGLADVLLITEAALKSGSLHTARFALEQGKTVMAVPGNITNPFSEGCNNLIKSGAVPVTSVDDVLFALKIGRMDRNTVRIHATPQEELVFGFIQEGVTSQDEIALATKLEGQELASVLTMLELAGHIRPAGGGNWVTS